MNKRRLCRALVDAAIEFGRGRPWGRYSSSSCFLIRVPGNPQLWIASVMGQAGEQFGLAMYAGEEGVGVVRRAFGDDAPPGGCSEMHDVHYLAFSLDPLGEIPPDMRRVLDAAGFRGRREAIAPFFIAKEPHRRARQPRRSEVETLLYALGAVKKAESDGRFGPDEEWLDGGAILLLSANGDPIDPDVEVSRESPPDAPRVMPTPARFPDRLSALPRSGVRWLVSLSTVPMVIRDDDRVMKALLVLEEPSGRLLVAKPVFGPDFDEPVETIVAAMEGKESGRSPGLPASVTFSNRRLYEMAVSGLSRLGVDADYRADVPALRVVEAGLAEHLTESEAADIDDLAEDVAPDFDGPDARENCGP